MEAVGRLVLANTRVSRAIFVLLMVCVARSGSGIELRRAPYLLHQRPDGVTVRWRTSDLHHTSVLRYGDTPYVLDHAVAATQTRQYFPGVQDWEAVVEGLEPDTQHFYAVEGDQAVLAGADYLVVGRPILRASDPIAAADSIRREMETALGDD